MRLATFQPDIPQNLGGLIRLSACFGVPLSVIEPCGFPLGDRGIRRVALDYEKMAAVRRHSSWQDFVSTRPNSDRIVLLSTHGKITLHNFSFRSNDCLLVGRESAGVPTELTKAAEAIIRIPMANGARSLNVVTAAAIAMAEALRQTNALPDLQQLGDN